MTGVLACVRFGAVCLSHYSEQSEEQVFSRLYTQSDGFIRMKENELLRPEVYDYM
jgi:hypothetical protein